MDNPSTRRRSGNQALCKGRASLPRHVYLVTAVVHQRQRIFADFDAGCLASKTLNAPELWPDAKLLAWVLMPDHLHLLVELGEVEVLSRVIQRVKSITAAKLRRHTGSPSRIWQRAFHERALRQSDDNKAAARYLIANPLRAGLVTDIGGYPFWGAVWMNTANPDPL